MISINIFDLPIDAALYGLGTLLRISRVPLEANRRSLLRMQFCVATYCNACQRRVVAFDSSESSVRMMRARLAMPLQSFQEKRQWEVLRIWTVRHQCRRPEDRQMFWEIWTLEKVILSART